MMRKVAFDLPQGGLGELKEAKNSPKISFRGAKLTSRYSYFDNKKVSKMEARASREAQRGRCLTYVREAAQRAATKSELHKTQIESLLGEKELCANLFNLFDESSAGYLVQDEWISHLKTSCSSCEDQDESRRDQEKLDLVELLEAVTYLVCQDNHVIPDTFYKIWSSRGVVTKLMRCIGKDGDDSTTVEDFMSFVIVITNPLKRGVLNEENIAWLESVFRENVGKGKEEFTLDEFKKIVPSKNEFFVERAFRIFDKDGSGTVSLAEFIETMHQFSGQGDDEKISFLFKVYDLNDDGLIDEADLREVMKACMVENGMHFDEKEVSDLANALFDDAVKEGCSGITVDDLKDQLQRHEGLLENLTISIGRWLVPPKPSAAKTWYQTFQEKLPHHFTASYWKNNKPFLLTLYLIIGINIILMVQRAYYFKDFAMLNGYTPNPLYMISRAMGRAILFNVVISLIFVLRYLMTFLRNMGLAHKLPLDHSIYFHKVVGWLIFSQAWLHTISHLINFGINIQPNPVKFLQMTAPYWKDYAANWTMMGYNTPPGCDIVPRESKLTEFCDWDAFHVPEGLTLETNITHCQACLPDSQGDKWSYVYWIFTTAPGVFGMPSGYANITGVVLIFIMTVIFVGSLAVVRRSGYFQVFYCTHLLYWAFWALMIIHAPNFYKWFIGVLVIWTIEFIYRVLNSFMGRGKTLVSAGVILPSRVTNLIIKRPAGFNFSPGDWVFIKIPEVARFEWHPFTISSAPEVHDTFTVHIRGVGEWTNRVYKYFEDEYVRQQDGVNTRENKVDKFRGTVRAKYDNARTIMSKSIRIKPTEDADFVSLAEKYTVDKEKQKDRIQKREDKLKQLSNSLHSDGSFKESKDDSNNNNNNNEAVVVEAPTTPTNNADIPRPQGFNKRFLKSLRYLRQEPTIIKYDTGSNSSIELPPGLTYDDGIERFELMVSDNGELRNRKVSHYDGPGKRAKLNKPLEIYIDGPFGSPSSNFYRAEHAVLIGTGIGITPFASILQSIMHRYWQVKKKCPQCDYQWSDDISSNMFNLKKVDFFWINRDQKSFEWFVKLLSQLEIEQAEHGGAMSRFLDMHMYVTSALQRTDMKAVGLQLALDLLHEKEKRDLVTGLKSRTNAGRPNWNKVFTKIKEQRMGKVTVFFCGNSSLGRILKLKCDEFGFTFKKEVF